jgi:hypothetical protein
MNTKVRLGVAAALLVLAWHPVAAQDQVPENSGFSGFFLGGAGHFSVASNLLARGTPLVDYVGDRRIASIFDAPATNSSLGFVATGEVNYTFSSTRTQLFFGNRLEDLLRLDLVFGLGVRQEIGAGGILAASALFTPADLEFWADPYVEGEDRQPTDLDFPGFRLRWGQIFGTGLELTVTDRFYRFEEESSGDWLISENRLDPDDQQLLERDGDILRIQALYRFDVRKRHRFEPAVRWVDDDHDGAAIANTGYALQLTYLYRSPKVIVDANLTYGTREAKETNPIYGSLLETDRWAGALTAFIPVKRFTSSALNVVVGGEVYRESANIDFYDSSLGMVFAGVLWRHIRK